VPLITLQENESERPHGQPFEGKSHHSINNVIRAMYDKLLQEGMEPDKAKSRIANIEPFNFYLEYIEKL